MKKHFLFILLQFVLFPSWKSNAQEIINTISGDGVHAYSGDGGPASSAEFQYPLAINMDASGNLYILDLLNSTLREIFAATGDINTIAGNYTLYGNTGDGGPANAALLYQPSGVCSDLSGNIYIADAGNNRIRKITAATGIITTIAGHDIAGFSGDGGLADTALLNDPVSVAVDSSGNVYIADEGNNKIRKITASTGYINTIAGTGIAGYSGDGSPATAAMLDTPTAVAVDHSRNIYIADYNNARIREIVASTGKIVTFAGTGMSGYSGDGFAATTAKLMTPIALSVDNSNNVYIADQDASVIRKVMAATGIITTIVGNGTPGFSGDDGLATLAELNYATGVCVNGAGDVIYIADKLNGRIRAVYPAALGVKESFHSNVSQVYPNPTSGKFIVTVATAGPCHIAIYDAVGTCVYRSFLRQKQSEIDPGNLSGGIYFLHLNSENVSIVKQISIIR